MQDLSWTDLEESGISVANRLLKPIFKELFPQNSNKSYDYHFWYYLKFYIDTDKKDTIEEEKIRFEKYLLTKYNRL